MIVLIVSSAAQADETKLTIQSGSKTVSLTLSDLLKRPSVKTITVAADRSYGGQAKTYRAIAAAELFRVSTFPQVEPLFSNASMAFPASYTRAIY